MNLTLINTYYAIEIYDEDSKCWRKPAHWNPSKKYVKERVRTLRMSGYDVRVKEVKEYQEEVIIRDLSTL